MSGKQAKITLKDIARVCGCSANTVSCALRGDSRISEEMRSLVQKTANEMGYVRNQLASSLRSGRTSIVAIIVNDLTSPYFLNISHAFETYLNKEGYDAIIFNACGEAARAEKVVRIAASISVEGIIYYPLANQVSAFQAIEHMGIPYVLMDRLQEGIIANTVRLDNHAGGRLAAGKLLAYGHRRFLYIAGPSTNSAQIDREKSFLQTVREAGVPEDCVRILTHQALERAARNGSIWDDLQPLDYTAIFAYCDAYAYQVLNELALHGVSVPGDMSVLGFDHLRKSMNYLPELSSIAVAEHFDTAEYAVDLLLQQIRRSDSKPAQATYLPVEYYDGGTVADPRKLSKIHIFH